MGEDERVDAFRDVSAPIEALEETFVISVIHDCVWSYENWIANSGTVVYSACNNQNLAINFTIAQDSICKSTGSITSNAIISISSGKNVEIVAQEKVELQENFETAQTSTLYFYMEECREKISD